MVLLCCMLFFIFVGINNWFHWVFFMLRYYFLHVIHAAWTYIIIWLFDVFMEVFLSYFKEYFRYFLLYCWRRGLNQIIFLFCCFFFKNCFRFRIPVSFNICCSLRLIQNFILFSLSIFDVLEFLKILYFIAMGIYLNTFGVGVIYI